MMKQYKFLLLTGFVLLAQFAIAQTAPLGKDVVKNFSEKMKSYQTIKASFTLTLENLKEGISDTYEGKLLLKDKKYYLDLMGMEVYYNGQTKWQFIPQANEVTISAPKSIEGGFFDDPTQIFTDYEKDFKSKFIGEKMEGGKGVYEVDLYPIDLSVPYTIIKLKFEKNSLEPISIKYQGKDGNNYIIKVKRFKANVPAKDDEFVFDTKKHKGIEIIDIR
jgi:outer membrane lipoprotein-sorting protein